MPLYIGDYLKDTAHLTTIEHGAYFLLLMHAWTQGGELPADPKRLRVIAKMSLREWRSSESQLMLFWDNVDGVLRNPRLDRELANARANSEQRKAAGKASAEARSRNKKGQREVNGRSTSVATPVSTEGQQNSRPSPSPSPIKKEREEELRSSPARAPCEEAVKVWNEICGPIHGNVLKLTETRRKHLRNRLLSDLGGDIARWRAYCQAINRSAFLSGGGDRGWVADFDWALQAGNLIKVREGKYDGRLKVPPTSDLLGPLKNVLNQTRSEPEPDYPTIDLQNGDYGYGE